MTRNPDYYFTPTRLADPPNPIAGVGLWNWNDLVYGAGCWIDLPDKHGMVYMPTISSGHIKYLGGGNQLRTIGHLLQWSMTRRTWRRWPKAPNHTREPGCRRNGTRKSRIRMSLGEAASIGQIHGMAFDPQTRILYAITPQAYTIKPGGLLPWSTAGT